MPIDKTRKIKFVAGIISVIIFCSYYVILFYRHIGTDIQAHAYLAYSFAVHNDKLFPNFLFFLLVAVLAGFSKNVYVYYSVSIIIVGLSLVAKLFITEFYLKKYSLFAKNRLLVSLTLSIVMLFLFCLPAFNFINTKHFLLGQLTPNVWHNSIIIFLMPFAILLFFKSYELLFSTDVQKGKRNYSRLYYWLFLMLL